MSSRGLTQLKGIKFVFSDWGGIENYNTGSSRGAIEFFKQDKFYEFVNKNEHIHFKFYLKRNAHPFIRCEYINGFMYDVPLKNEKPDEILKKFISARNRCN